VTRRANARIAGITFLAYNAFGISAMILSRRAIHGEGIVAKLASIAQHATDVRIAALLALCCGFCALVLGVALWAVTREQDPDLAMLALAFRVGEGITGAMSVQASNALLWLATATGPDAPGVEEARALGAYLVHGSGVAASFFPVGSTLFCWLLLRGRMIPMGLAWLGLVASVLWVLSIPLDALGILRGPLTWLVWIPMAAFEIPFALWLVFKGVAPRPVAPLAEAT
jgi:hypothetical protein